VHNEEVHSFTPANRAIISTDLVRTGKSAYFDRSLIS
jgi:hypothetical protein